MRDIEGLVTAILIHFTTYSVHSFIIIIFIWPLFKYYFIMLVVLVATWALFGSWIPTMCNSTSCAQVQELLWTHHGDNRECTLDLLITHIILIKINISINSTNLSRGYIFQFKYSGRAEVRRRNKIFCDGVLQRKH